MPTVIPPVPDRDDQWFWEGVDRGMLLLQRCAGCGKLRHPPGPMCARCGSLDWETQAATGRGTVHTWILSHHPTEPDALPRVVVLVQLDEGVRIVSNLQEVDERDVHNDMAVEVCFVRVDDGVTLPQFRPAGPRSP